MDFLNCSVELPNDEVSDTKDDDTCLPVGRVVMLLGNKIPLTLLPLLKLRKLKRLWWTKKSQTP